MYARTCLHVLDLNGITIRPRGDVPPIDRERHQRVNQSTLAKRLQAYTRVGTPDLDDPAVQP